MKVDEVRLESEVWEIVCPLTYSIFYNPSVNRLHGTCVRFEENVIVARYSNRGVGRYRPWVSVTPECSATARPHLTRCLHNQASNVFHLSLENQPSNRINVLPDSVQSRSLVFQILQVDWLILRLLYMNISSIFSLAE